MAENETPQSQDAPGEFLLYYECMTRVFLADALTEEGSALQLTLLDMNMEISREAAEWSTILVQAPISRTGMLMENLKDSEFFSIRRTLA